MTSSVHHDPPHAGASHTGPAGSAQHPQHRRHRRWHPVRSALRGFALGAALGAVGLLTVWATGFLDPAPVMSFLGGDAAEQVMDEPDTELRRHVIAACDETLSRTNCRCFWGQTRSVWTPDSVEPVMQALTERNRYAGQLTRMKLDKVIGEDGNRLVMQALIQCLK